jgi:hypothetical protein
MLVSNKKVVLQIRTNTLDFLSQLFGEVRSNLTASPKTVVATD